MPEKSEIGEKQRKKRLFCSLGRHLQSQTDKPIYWIKSDQPSKNLLVSNVIRPLLATILYLYESMGQLSSQS